MSVFSKIYEDRMQQIRESEEFKNKQTLNFLDTIFSSMVISSFSYKKDIPTFIRQIPDYIEETIYYSGILAFFEDGGEYYITACTPCGRLLNNGMYDSYNCIFRNGEMKLKTIDEIEILYDNHKAVPPVVLVNEILEKCYSALRAVDMALKRASTPDIYAGADENAITNIVHAIEVSYNTQTPYAIVNSDWIGKELTKLSMYNDEENKIAELWETFVKYKNLLYTTFGINNVEISKTERLTKRESESNSEIIRYGLFSDRYHHRKDWLERIKNHFGVDIEIEICRNADTVVDVKASNEEKEELYKLQVAPYLGMDNTQNGGEENGENETVGNN